MEFVPPLAPNGKLRLVYPVFQRQGSDGGEVTGIAGGKDKAVRQRRTTDEDIKVIYRPAATPQGRFLVGEDFQRWANGQHLFSKQHPKFCHLLVLSGLPSGCAIACAEEQFRNGYFGYKASRQANRAELRVKLKFTPQVMHADIGIEQIAGTHSSTSGRLL